MWFDKSNLWVIFWFRSNKPRKMKLVENLPSTTCGAAQRQCNEQHFRDDDEFTDYFYRTTGDNSNATIPPSTPPTVAAAGQSMTKEPQKILSI